MAFLPVPVPFRTISRNTHGVCNRQLRGARDAYSSLATPSYTSGRFTRRLFLRSLGAFTGLSVSAHLGAQELVDVSELDTVREARARLNVCDALIDDAKWDEVRTVLAKRPLAGMPETSRVIVQSAKGDERFALAGIREDVLSAMRLLDTAVYSNVFVGEDRVVLGVNVDYDTPRVYLADLKAALDDLIDVATQTRA